MPKNYDVVPNVRRGGWDVRANEGARLVSRHQLRGDAFTAAERYVRNAGGGEVRLYDQGGALIQVYAVELTARSQAGSVARAGTGQ